MAIIGASQDNAPLIHSEVLVSRLWGKMVAEPDTHDRRIVRKRSARTAVYFLGSGHRITIEIDLN